MPRLMQRQKPHAHVDEDEGTGWRIDGLLFNGREDEGAARHRAENRARIAAERQRVHIWTGK